LDDLEDERLDEDFEYDLPWRLDLELDSLGVLPRLFLSSVFLLSPSLLSPSLLPPRYLSADRDRLLVALLFLR
jgi:hypothetical protein